MVVIDANQAYHHYPEWTSEINYLTGKVQSFDMSRLSDFFLLLRRDGILLNVSYQDVKPGSGINPFYCNGVQQHYK